METTLPRIHIQPVVSNLGESIKLEWITTNGLGGYASSTILGINTRKYHGLLVASFNPPTDRRVLLAGLDEEIESEGENYSLGSIDSKKGIHPQGYRFLSSFSLNPLPTFGYNVHGTHIVKNIFMPHEKNATIVIYNVWNSSENEVLIHLFPLVNSRHFHSVTNRNALAWSFNQRVSKQTVTIQPSSPISTLLLFSSEGKYSERGKKWIKGVRYSVDEARGDSHLDDVFRSGQFQIGVGPGEKKKFYLLAVAEKNLEQAENAFSSINGSFADVKDLYKLELNRRKGLLIQFGEKYPDVRMNRWLKWLILAAESFIVKRLSTQTKSVIAGYHWFEDWGRDSLISLPGLTLVTGRFSDAKEILLTLKHYCQEGIIPNRFPDHAGDKPQYNTVDATLWYFNAVLQFLKYTGDFSFVHKQLLNTLHSIIEQHIRGTGYGIHMDQDGLITHGPQLTWMDATIDNQPVTPRDGKTVEIQALWFNALKIMQLLATHFDQTEDAQRFARLSAKVKRSFREKFWHDSRGYLLDVLCNEVQDRSLRPNQLIAISLDFSMLDGEQCTRVVDVVSTKLLMRGRTYGLRTLSPDHPCYVGEYSGVWADRNRAYHNGTAWPWLLGPFVTAFLKAKNYERQWRIFALRNFLQPLFHDEIFRAGCGTISEIFDGDAPYTPKGCISQAWSVAEPLRAYMEDVLVKRPPFEKQVLSILNGACAN